MSENRIKTVDGTVATYTYDGGPLRVKRVVTGATVVNIYSGSKLIAVYTNGALNSEYVYAGNTMLAGLDGGWPTRGASRWLNSPRTLRVPRP